MHRRTTMPQAIHHQPMPLAKSKEDLSMLSVMAKQDEKELEEVLVFCKKQSEPDYENAASVLTRVNVGKLFRYPNIKKKYQANLAETDEEVDQSLLGFDCTDFLALRVRMLLEFIFLKESDLTMTSHSEKQSSIHFLKKEILIALESLRVTLLIKKSLDVFSRRKRAANQHVLAKNIAERIFSLSENDPFILVASWDTHNFYISFNRRHHAIHVEIYNFMSEERLPLTTIINGEKHYYPRYIGKIFLNEREKLIAYIENVFIVQNLSKNQAIEAIYDLRDIFSKPDRDRFSNSAFPLQKNANCTIYNYTAAMHARAAADLKSEHMKREVIAFVEFERMAAARPLKDQTISLEKFNHLHRELFLKEDRVFGSAINILSMILTAIPSASVIVDEIDIYQLLSSLQDPAIKVKAYLREINRDLYKTTSINLDNSYLNDNDAMQLTKIFTSLPYLEKISLSRNNITDSGAIALANTLSKMPQLKMLDLSFNQIKDEGVFAIIETLALGTNLRSLNLDSNPFNFSNAQMLAAALHVDACIDLGIDWYSASDGLSNLPAIIASPDIPFPEKEKQKEKSDEKAVQNNPAGFFENQQNKRRLKGLPEREATQFKRIKLTLNS